MGIRRIKVTVARKNKIPIKREPFLMEYMPDIESLAELERLYLSQQIRLYSQNILLGLQRQCMPVITHEEWVKSGILPKKEK